MASVGGSYNTTTITSLGMGRQPVVALLGLKISLMFNDVHNVAVLSWVEPCNTVQCSSPESNAESSNS